MVLTIQVILVAHNIGGACISYAMECFPNKVSKAIFVAAAMIQDGQRAFDVFVPQVFLYDRFSDGLSAPRYALLNIKLLRNY